MQKALIRRYKVIWEETQCIGVEGGVIPAGEVEVWAYDMDEACRVAQTNVAIDNYMYGMSIHIFNLRAIPIGWEDEDTNKKEKHEN